MIALRDGKTGKTWQSLSNPKSIIRICYTYSDSFQEAISFLPLVKIHI
jgi:hypothetical protein